MAMVEENKFNNNLSKYLDFGKWTFKCLKICEIINDDIEDHEILDIILHLKPTSFNNLCYDLIVNSLYDRKIVLNVNQIRFINMLSKYILISHQKKDIRIFEDKLDRIENYFNNSIN